MSLIFAAPYLNSKLSHSPSAHESTTTNKIRHVRLSVLRDFSPIASTKPVGTRNSSFLHHAQCRSLLQLHSYTLGSPTRRLHANLQSQTKQTTLDSPHLLISTPTASNKPNCTFTFFFLHQAQFCTVLQLSICTVSLPAHRPYAILPSKIKQNRSDGPPLAISLPIVSSKPVHILLSSLLHRAERRSLLQLHAYTPSPLTHRLHAKQPPETEKKRWLVRTS